MTKIAPIFGPQNFFQDIYFYELLEIVTSYHPMQFKGKLMNQTWENSKKPNFGSYFGSFDLNLGPRIFFSWCLPLLDVRNCCKISLHSISRKTYDPNSRKWQKISFWTRFRPAELTFGCQFF